MAVVGFRWVKKRKEKQNKSFIQNEDIENNKDDTTPANANQEKSNDLSPISHTKINGLHFRRESMLSSGDSARLVMNILPTAVETCEIVPPDIDDVTGDVEKSIDPFKVETKTNGVLSHPPVKHTLKAIPIKVVPKQPPKKEMKLKRHAKKK